jgi:hypothetical protein
MNAKEKAEFIRNLTNSIRDELIGKTGQMPEEWDGHEIRELLAYKFTREKTDVVKGKRKKEYLKALFRL